MSISRYNMIGLVDYDFCAYNKVGKLYIPNLEILKLSSYLKHEKDQMCRLLSLDETNLSVYDKIYFFCERGDLINIPPQYLSANNIEYRGLAFTKNKYVPFENELIEYTLPRTSIYKPMLYEKYQNGATEEAINHFLDDTYYRACINNKILPIPATERRKRFYLYDTDFFYEGWEKILEEISKRHPSTIISVYPIYCNKISTYFTMRGFTKLSRSNTIILDLPIKLDEMPILLNKYRLKLLGDITKTANVFLPLGGSYKMEEMYYKNFYFTMNELFFYWGAGIPIKIKYIPPQLGYINPLVELSLLIEKWSNLNTDNKQNKTLQELFPKRKHKHEPTIYEQQMYLLNNYNLKMKALFSQSFEQLTARGRWIL